MVFNRKSVLPVAHSYYGNSGRTVSMIEHQEQKVFWDIVIKRKGKYSFILEGVLSGLMTFEAGIWIPNEPNNKIGIKKNKDKTLTFREIKKNGRYFLGPLFNLEPGTYHFYVKNISNKMPKHNFKIYNLHVEGPAMVSSILIEGTLPLREARHASASFNKTYLKIPRDEGKYFYREICLHQPRPNTYFTFSFSGGYIGLVTKKDYFDAERTYINKRKEHTHINFSIWDYEGKETIMHKPNEKTIYKDFGHEGSGVHSHYIANIHTGYKYGFVLKMEKGTDENDMEITDYSAYVINLGPIEKKYGENVIQEPEKELDYDKWTFIATIRRPGNHYIGGRGDTTNFGGFTENTGKVNGHLYHRRFLMGNDWGSRDGKTWTPAFQMTFITKDIENSNCVPRPDLRMLDIGMGGKIPTSDEYPEYYTMNLPEPVNEPPAHLVHFLEMDVNMN
jgi:hypothetical protein